MKSVTGQHPEMYKGTQQVISKLQRGVIALIFYEISFHRDPTAPQSHNRAPYEHQKWPAKRVSVKPLSAWIQSPIKPANDAESDNMCDWLSQREFLEMSGCTNWTAVTVNPLCRRWHPLMERIWPLQSSERKQQLLLQARRRKKQKKN